MREGGVGSGVTMEGKRDAVGKNSPDLFYLRAGGARRGRWKMGKGRGRA